MKTKIFTLSLCMLATVSLAAQQVDKARVEANAGAAQDAAAALKGADTGEKAWKFDGTVGVNAAATGLVNWAAGGKNNVNGIAYAKLHLLYHKNAIAWETNFDTDFGLTWIDQDEDAFQKSSDNIKLATKFGWEFRESWYLTVLGGFQSQYAPGRNYQTGYNDVISKWLAPSYTDVSVGIDWKKSYKGADFSVYLSPVAGRITTAYVGESFNKRYSKEAALGAEIYALEQAKGTSAETAAQAAYDAAASLYDEGGIGYANQQNAHTDIRSTLQDAYGVSYYDAAGNKMYDRAARAEFGLSFKGAIAYKYKDLTLGTSLALFTPYAGKGTALDTYVAGSKATDTYFQYSSMNRYFGMFDVDWDVALGYQFLKCLQVTLQTNLKYYPGTLIADKNGDVSERVQFKGVIGIGVGYSF